MIAYYDEVFRDSHSDFLYVISRMMQDLNNWVKNIEGSKFDDDNQLIEDSVSKGQFRSYKIREERLTKLLSFAVNAENLILSLSEEFTRLTEEKRTVAHQLTNLEIDFKNFKLAQCSPLCPRICNSMRDLGKTQRNEMRREVHELQVRNDMPQIF